MGRAGSPTIGQARPGTRWRIEDSSRAGPSRRISEANGANDRDTVEEVAPRLPATRRTKTRAHDTFTRPIGTKATR